MIIYGLQRRHMDKQSTLEKQLLEILEKKDYVQLEQHKNPVQWSSLTKKERHLLGLLFMAQGETQLSLGDTQVFDSFALASQVVPENPLIFYQQALAYATQEGNLRCLMSACQALESATSISHDFFDAWSAWGTLLVRIGDLQAEASYYQDAHQKFTQAQQHSQHATQDKLANLYWQWGISWHLLGQLSGEAHDFYCALEKYRQAHEQHLRDVAFLNDYGNAVAELATLLGKKELFLEAVDLFQKVVQASPEYFHGWLNLGCAYLRLFEYHNEEQYFITANDSFKRASEINSNYVDLWLNWGRLYANSGKGTENLEHLKISCDKFSKANLCEPNNPDVLSWWAEAQMLCGCYNEQLPLLREAEEKIIRSLEINAENADAWRVYGGCLTELGRYFGDEAYYVQAIEKLRYGISLNQRNALLWYGLSLAHFSIGDLRNDVGMLEEAARLYAKVMECGGQHIPQFWNDWGVALMRLSEATYDQSILESAIEKFEKAIGGQDISIVMPDCDLEWLYNYACAYDFLGDFTENVRDHERAVLVLSYVVQQDPTYTHARYNLAVSLTHLGVLIDDADCFYKALEHFEIVLNEELEDETAWNDWGMTLLNLARLIEDPLHSNQSSRIYSLAEEKFNHAIALGCTAAFYNLACLYSLNKNFTMAMFYIERADQAKALPSIDDILHDDWLEGLRETPDFRNFITLLSQKQDSE